VLSPCGGIRQNEDLWHESGRSWRSWAHSLESSGADDTAHSADVAAAGNEKTVVLHRVQFDAGAMGLRVNSVTGKVEVMKPDGQAAQKGVHLGWHLHAIDGKYQFTVPRLLGYVQSGRPYEVTFSEDAKPLQTCSSNSTWQDSNGQSCYFYQVNSWCGRGGWPTDAFTKSQHCADIDNCDFKDFAVDALSARDACCPCGGGAGSDGAARSRASGRDRGANPTGFYVPGSFLRENWKSVALFAAMAVAFMTYAAINLGADEYGLNREESMGI